MWCSLVGQASRLAFRTLTPRPTPRSHITSTYFSLPIITSIALGYPHAPPLVPPRSAWGLVTHNLPQNHTLPPRIHHEPKAPARVRRDFQSPACHSRAHRGIKFQPKRSPPHFSSRPLFPSNSALFPTCPLLLPPQRAHNPSTPPPFIEGRAHNASAASNHSFRGLASQDARMESTPAMHLAFCCKASRRRCVSTEQSASPRNAAADSWSAPRTKLAKLFACEDSASQAHRAPRLVRT
jgi:hypothetical protein